MGWRCDNRDNAGISDITCDNGRHRWNSINVWKNWSTFMISRRNGLCGCEWIVRFRWPSSSPITAPTLSFLLRIKLSSSSWLSSVTALLPRRSVAVTIPYYGDFFILGSPDTWVCIYVRYCTVFVLRLRLIDSTNHYIFIEIMWLPYHQSI